MRVSNVIRRTADVTVACVGLLFGAPLMALVALLVRVRLGSPVLFRQRRLGLGGAPFELIKFRSMKHPRPGREAPEFDRERITGLGHVLRSWSLDELPSLVNLLRGDISLVGPRPLPVHYWDRFTTEQLRRFEVRPGITGLAQALGRNHIDWPERLALDVQYVSERSLLFDAKIVLRTIPVVLRRHGVGHGGAATMHELPHQVKPAVAGE